MLVNINEILDRFVDSGQKVLCRLPEIREHVAEYIRLNLYKFNAFCRHTCISGLHHCDKEVQ